MDQIGKSLLIIGVVIALLGLAMMFGPKRLPLNFHFQRGNFNCYFPLGASILISIILTLVLSFLNRR